MSVVPTRKGMDEQFVHKNRLQEHAQRASIPLPSYQTVNEGSQHAPQFRSTVLIDGAKFVSPCTFHNRRAAEQYVAKFALEQITSTIKLEGIPLIHNDTTFCKCILHEYADKMKLDKPAYSTTLSKGLLPLFITSVTFDGKIYEGRAGKNKKEAEQIAARTVIEWILGNSSKGIFMSEIIKSKVRLYDAINGCSVTSLKETGSHKKQASNVPCLVQTENHSVDTVVTENHVQIVPAKDVLSVRCPIPSEAEKKSNGITPICPVPSDSEINCGDITSAVHPIPSKAGQDSEGIVVKLCSNLIDNGKTPPTLPRNNLLAGATSSLINPVSNELNPAQNIQVKGEPCDSPVVLNDSRSVKATSRGKRSHNKDDKGSPPKKTRSTEYCLRSRNQQTPE